MEKTIRKEFRVYSNHLRKLAQLKKWTGVSMNELNRRAIDLIWMHRDSIPEYKPEAEKEDS